MSLLNDASLILVPSAIKTGEVLVQKPLPNKFADETGNYDGNDPQGSANLTFTRASNASRVNADGLLEKVRSNSLLQSNSFDTTWINANSTNTSGQSGYDGSSDAWLLSKTGASGRITQTISVSGIFTFSVYVKKGTTDWVLLYKTGTGEGGRYFDLTNGVIGSSVATAPIDSKIEQVGTSDWYRCSIVGNSATAVVIYVADSNGSASGTSGNIYIQNAQLEQGDIATDYLETTTSARSTFAGITVDGTSVPNVPRLDYSGGASCPSLLLEPQRTNAALWSEQFNNWTRSARVDLTTNNTTAPDGTQSADKIELNATGGNETYYYISAIAIGYTLSVFVKKNTARWFCIGTNSPLNNRVFFDLDNGVVGTEATGYTGAIEAIGTDGWYRCSITIGTGASLSQFFDLMLSNADGSLSGTVGDSVWIWGAQCEQGAYATSYIPTLGSTVTRLADAASKTGISSLIGQSEGVIYWEFNVPAEVLNNTAYYLEINANDGTSSNKLALNYYNSGRIQFVAFVGGSLVVNINLNSYGLTAGNHKFALAYKLNDYVAYVDGVSVGTDTSAAVPATSKIELYDTSGGVNVIKQILLFKTRLTNAQLAELTTL